MGRKRIKIYRRSPLASLEPELRWAIQGSGWHVLVETYADAWAWIDDPTNRLWVTLQQQNTGSGIRPNRMMEPR